MSKNPVLYCLLVGEHCIVDAGRRFISSVRAQYVYGGGESTSFGGEEFKGKKVAYSK